MEEKNKNTKGTVDWDEINRLFALTKQTPNFSNVTFAPVEATDATTLSEEEKNRYQAKGEEILRTGKYAVVMLAGGQGTRLGHSGPKGTFDFGLPTHQTIFEVFAERLKKASDTYGVTIPWYLMTSRENNAETMAFFEEHQYFGYRDGVKRFFVQKELPMLNEQGKPIINQDGTIKEAANGHGDVYRALQQEGILAEMKEQGTEWVFICGVDNVLAPLADPLLIGFSAIQQNDITSISTIKAEPQERVGVLAKKNGKTSVVEYTELPNELKEARKENGELLYSEAHLLMNVFHISVLEEVAENPLTYHVAHKKCDQYNEAGEWVKATEPNAYKFETLLFDAFERVKKIGVLRYRREECFAPIKNAEGVDSPETARRLYMAYNLIKNGNNESKTN